MSYQLPRGMAGYIGKLRSFSVNARLIMMSSFLAGLALGGYHFLINFYVLSLGYDEAFIGTLQTVEAMAAIFFALPAAYLANRFPQKYVILFMTTTVFLALLGMIVLPTTFSLVALRMILGMSLGGREVAIAPLLMANTRDDERQWVFSINTGLMMTAMFVGNTIGGSLPTWWANLISISPTDVLAYQLALTTLLLIGVFIFIPLIHLDIANSHHNRNATMPWNLIRRYGYPLLPFLLPQIVIGLGAGLMQPFMNIYFRNVYGQPDPIIGWVFAFGGISMAIAQLLAPPLADAHGKIKVVVFSQAFSIPFLILLGLGAYFVPSGNGSPVLWFWIAVIAYNFRLGLMNMANPVYQTFVLEQVNEEMRALAVSLSSISFQFGWFIMPQVSGWMQVEFREYGFVPIFFSVALLYAIAVTMQYFFFMRKPATNFTASVKPPPSL